MEIKIQFETKNDSSSYEGIARVNNLSSGISSPDLFKWESDLEWAQGRDVPVKQISIFSDGAFIGRISTGGTLGNFVEMWENKF